MEAHATGRHGHAEGRWLMRAMQKEGDEEFVPGSEGEDCEGELCCAKPALRRRKRTVDYWSESVDTTFNDRPGYTHFGRTRKGGDVRPLRKEQPIPKKIVESVTLLNFFGREGNQPLPLPQAKSTSQKSKSTSQNVRHKPPSTRTKWGRPTKKKPDNDKQFRRTLMAVKADGECATPPAKRKKWGGTVSYLVCN